MWWCIPERTYAEHDSLKYSSALFYKEKEIISIIGSTPGRSWPNTDLVFGNKVCSSHQPNAQTIVKKDISPSAKGNGSFSFFFFKYEQVRAFLLQCYPFNTVHSTFYVFQILTWKLKIQEYLFCLFLVLFKEGLPPYKCCHCDS